MKKQEYILNNFSRSVSQFYNKVSIEYFGRIVPQKDGLQNLPKKELEKLFHIIEFEKRF